MDWPALYNNRRVRHARKRSLYTHRSGPLIGLVMSYSPEAKRFMRTSTENFGGAMPTKPQAVEFECWTIMRDGRTINITCAGNLVDEPPGWLFPGEVPARVLVTVQPIEGDAKR